MKKKFFPILFALVAASCSDKQIEITTEYIINENWDEHANAIEINKQKVKKDSVINPFTELNNTEILSKLENDSSFIFFANVKYNGDKYSTRKIYFNKDNDFYWKEGYLAGNEIKDTVKRIGALEQNYWYKFSYLKTHPYYVYVYIDSSNRVHRFDVNLANY
jgi:hypothetical protein